MEEIKWEDFNKFEKIDDLYLPECGEGETFISQIVTAVTKLTYKWFNDGDVFDNTYYLSGWCNDLSSYANWLHTYVPETRKILERIYKLSSEFEYTELLYDLNTLVMNEEFLSNYKNASKTEESIYECEGCFKFDDYDDYDDYDDDYDDDDEEEDW